MLRALCIDQDEQDRLFLRDLLKRTIDVESEGAASFEEGRRYLSQGIQFDLIISDISTGDESVVSFYEYLVRWNFQGAFVVFSDLEATPYERQMLRKLKSSSQPPIIPKACVDALCLEVFYRLRERGLIPGSEG
jgi:DNA-binding NarL/FixJ family response regulator